MMSEKPHSDLALYRLVKGGEGGLGVNLGDLYDREAEVRILGIPIKMTLKAFPKRLIDKLIIVQQRVDAKIKEEAEKAKNA